MAAQTLRSLPRQSTVANMVSASASCPFLRMAESQQSNYLLNFGGECPFLGMVEGQKRPLMTSSSPVNAPAHAQMAPSTSSLLAYPNLDASQFMEANNLFLMQELQAAADMQNSVEREIAHGFEDRYTEMKKKRTLPYSSLRKGRRFWGFFD